MAEDLSFKLAKGCVDYFGEDVDKILYIISTIKNIISLYPNIKPLDTPVFELSNMLKDKYGEDEKLIYDLKDQGGELLSLRYDLTVPLVRYCIENSIKSIKRYQYGKVYRRDQPMRGKLREFYQFDIDFIGNYGEYNSEIEIFKIINLVLTALNITNYKIVYNYRQNLYAIYQKLNILPKLYKSVSSSIDKLDKHEWKYVENELIDKGITCINKLKEFLDNNYLDDSLKNYNLILLQKCCLFNIQNLEFNNKLARGLDYYSGIIYEVVIPGSDIGTIIAGGRYDSFINKYLKDTSAIGVSFGINRLVYYVIYQQPKNNLIYVGQIDGDINYKLQIINILLDNNFKVYYEYRNIKFKKQLEYCLDHNIKTMILFGTSEINKNVVIIKNTETRIQKECTLTDLINELKLE